MEKEEIYQLVKWHAEDTGVCSMAGHMRRCSTTYSKIIELGKEALPSILEYLRSEKGGMSIILLLQDITHESPYKPDTESTPGITKYTVETCVEAWLAWGKVKGYIN
jgi:hypothetical protein